MNINNPAAFGFLLVIPLIIALYLLRLKRKKFIVSSTFFWNEMVQDLQANVPFQKLRWNLLLFLQLLIAAAIILSLLDPTVFASLNEGRKTIFVIDTSASMSATDTGVSRLESAVSQIRAYCQSLSERENVMIIRAGEHAEMILDFTDNLPAIERVLGSIQVGHTRSDMATAYALAQGKAAETDQPFIVIASDFSCIDSEIFTDPPYPLSFLQTGEGGANVAIIDFTLSGMLDGEIPDVISPFIALRNFTDQQVACNIEFFLDGELVDVRSLEIEPGSRIGRQFSDVPFPLAADSNGVLEARLDITDDLEIDNTAYTLPGLGEAMTVLLVGDDNFLLLSLMGIPGIRLFQMSETEYESGADFDLTFFSGWAPETLSPGNYVFFDPPDRDYLPCRIGDQVDGPQVTDWEDGHPLLRFVNPGSFQVFRATQVEAAPGALTLIDADSTSLMVYGERNYVKALVFPFDLTSSDLITKPTFPILIYNIVSFYRGYIEGSNTGLRTQGITPVRVDALGDKVILSGPDGNGLEFPVDAGHVYLDVDHIGVYKLEYESSGEDGEMTLVANFFDESESDIAAISDLDPSIGGGQARRFEVEGEKRIWKYLGFIALGILCIEWLFYHRKGF